MFFLLRAAFWLTLVLALLPTGSSQPAASQAESTVGATDAVVAASAAMSDMSSFCDRQPDACVVGSQAAVAIGQRAQAGARMVYDFINERVARSETGSIPQPKGEPKLMAVSFPGSQNTLRPADLAPAWHGSAPHAATVGNVVMPRPDPRKGAKHRA